MASALQSALGKTQSRPKPHKCSATDRVVFIGNSEPFVPSTHQYSKVAKYYETLNNNNSAFNGKNLSDNQCTSQF